MMFKLEVRSLWSLHVQCDRSDENIVLQRPDATNAYIPLRTIQHFRCASHYGSTLEWMVTIANVEYGETARNLLNRNGVSWMTNTSEMSESLLTLDSEAGYNVTSIECIITFDNDGKFQRCSVYVKIIIYGE